MRGEAMTLLPWPALPPLVTGLSVHLQRELTIYERARAEAALQRLRIACEALNAVQAESRQSDAFWFEAVYDKLVSKALLQIGEVPPA
jgi:hypothetical protein